MGRRTSAALLSLIVMLGLLVAAAPARAVQAPHDLLVSDDPAGFTPHILDGEVLAVAVVGDTVVVGGAFTRAQNAAGGTEIARTNILAFDRTTGAIDTAFVPVVNNKVRTLAPAADGQSVFVGGQFSTLNGATAHKVVRLDIDTGQPVAGFDAGLIDANVEDLKLVGDRLFIAGHFVQVQFQTRKLFAELDPDTGALRPSTADFEGIFTNGTAHIRKFDVNPDGDTLVAVGNFMTVNGQARRQIAMLDVSGAPTLLTDWRSTQLEPVCKSTFGYYVRDVDYAPDGGHFVVVTTGSYGPGPPTLCDTASRWTSDDRGQAVNPTWVDYTGGDSAYSVALTGSVSYVGGHMRWFNNPFMGDAQGPGAVSREGIAALDPVNGVPLSWNPGRTRGRAVFDMVATDDGLWVGSDTDRIGNFEYHGRIAFFPLAGGTEVPQPDPAGLPVSAHVVAESGAEPVTSRDFDGDTASAPAPVPSGDVDWGEVRGGFWLDGSLYLVADADLTVRSFDGASYGEQETLELYGLTQFESQMAEMTGLVYEAGSIYYTVSGNSNLYRRYFSVESGIVGAERFTVADGGVDWSDARGMFSADGHLYWAHDDTGDLHRVTWVNGVPQTGTDTVVSGPDSDGQDWRGVAMFTLPGEAPNPPATVEFVESAVDTISGSSSVHTVAVPAGVEAGDVMVMSLTYNSGSHTVTDPAGWERADEAGTNNTTTVMWTRTATATDAGSSVAVTTSAAVKAALLLGAYRGADVSADNVDVAREKTNRASHTTPELTAPAGSWVVSMWADKTGATTAWTAPVGEQVRETGADTGGGHVSWLYTDSGGTVPAGDVGGLVATANSATKQATMSTVVLVPAG